ISAQQGVHNRRSLASSPTRRSSDLCCDDMREMNRQHDPGRPRHPQMHTAAAFAPRLRQDLLDAGYTIAQLRELFGPRAEAALEREQFLPALTSARERPGPGADRKSTRLNSSHV